MQAKLSSKDRADIFEGEEIFEERNEVRNGDGRVIKVRRKTQKEREGGLARELGCYP